MMSKGLEALEKIRNHSHYESDLDAENGFAYIENKKLYKNEINNIEKELKSLEISKELIAKIKELCQKYETEPFDLGFKTILQLISEKEEELYD